MNMYTTGLTFHLFLKKKLFGGQWAVLSNPPQTESSVQRMAKKS